MTSLLSGRRRTWHNPQHRPRPCPRLGALGYTQMTKRELIEPTPGDKRFVRRDEKGQFTEQVDVGKSLAADQRQHSAAKAKRGEGDKGDR